ncbi:MAG: integrase/recombinase XerD [Parvicella sp.]|jgi:integrase/recombinase XerD
MPCRFYKIDRPRKDKELPKIISKEEVLRMISNTKNLKHRCSIEFLYSKRMRNSEVLSLKKEHIDCKRVVINTKRAKGNKDRNTLLGKKLLETLRAYYVAYKPTEYLFEGQ